jgi:hypothetical protein
MKLAPFFTLALLPVFAFAQLEFAETTITKEATSETREVVGNFAFTNVGDSPITIQRTRSSCGCTVAELDKRRYEPGESGSIKAVFTIGNREGRQVKTISVITDEPSRPAYQLSLETDIPKFVDLSSRMLFWVRNGETERRAIDLTFSPDRPTEILEIKPRGDGFEAEIETVEEGTKYKLWITPTDTDERRRVTYELVTDKPSHRPRSIFVFAYIR